jgi:hypothetical protein
MREPETTLSRHHSIVFFISALGRDGYDPSHSKANERGSLPQKQLLPLWLLLPFFDKAGGIVSYVSFTSTLLPQRRCFRFFDCNARHCCHSPEIRGTCQCFILKLF